MRVALIYLDSFPVGYVPSIQIMSDCKALTKNEFLLKY